MLRFIGRCRQSRSRSGDVEGPEETPFRNWYTTHIYPHCRWPSLIHLCVDLTHISTSLGQARNILQSYDRLKHLQNCSGVLADDAAGDRTTETIYNDADPDQIETLPDTQLHRNVDLELLHADKEGIFFSSSSALVYFIVLNRRWKDMSKYISSYHLQFMALPQASWWKKGYKMLTQFRYQP